MDLFSILQESKNENLRESGILRSIRAIEAMHEFLEEGGELNASPPNNTISEAMMVLYCSGTMGLQFYLHKGGQFNPEFSSEKAEENEFMGLLHYAPLNEKVELIDLFIASGGKFSPEKRNKYGASELCYIIDQTSREDRLSALKKYIENGGKFSPDAHSVGGRNEFMLLVDSLGIEGIEFFLENGGKLNPSSRTTHGSSEAQYAAHAGLDGLKMFVVSGGKFNTDVQDGDFTDAMSIAMHAGLEGLEFFIKNGGKFSPGIKNRKGWNEAMIIAEFIGAEGLDFFLANDGGINFDNYVIYQGKTVTEETLIRNAYGGEIPAPIIRAAKNPHVFFTPRPR